jgi:hypothetical protein
MTTKIIEPPKKEKTQKPGDKKPTPPPPKDGVVQKPEQTPAKAAPPKDGVVQAPNTTPAKATPPPATAKEGKSEAKKVETPEAKEGKSEAKKVETPEAKEGKSNAKDAKSPPQVGEAKQKPNATPKKPPPPAKIGNHTRLKERTAWNTDPSEIFKSEYSIDIHSITSGIGVTFKAFVTNFSDSFSSNWNSINAVGKMDPIQTFQNTVRVITIEFDVIASSLAEAKTNMAKCQKLIRSLYPTYKTSPGALNASLRAPPYFKIKFANLVQSKNGGNTIAGKPGQAAANTGLFGTLAGVDYAPSFDVGVYTASGNIYPKLVSLSLELTVLHDFALGYDAGGSLRGAKTFGQFPYGIEGTGPSNPTSFSDIDEITSINQLNSIEASAAANKSIEDEKKKVDEAKEKEKKPAGGTTSPGAKPTTSQQKAVEKSKKAKVLQMDKHVGK